MAVRVTCDTSLTACRNASSGPIGYGLRSPPTTSASTILEDARVLTQKQGGDPDRWNDVKQRLPLLADPTWAAKVKYGAARGMEPVVFVNHVRTYYDVLVKQDEEEKGRSLDRRAQAQAAGVVGPGSVATRLKIPLATHRSPRPAHRHSLEHDG